MLLCRPTKWKKLCWKFQLYTLKIGDWTEYLWSEFTSALKTLLRSLYPRSLVLFSKGSNAKDGDIVSVVSILEAKNRICREVRLPNNTNNRTTTSEGYPKLFSGRKPNSVTDRSVHDKHVQTPKASLRDPYRVHMDICKLGSRGIALFQTIDHKFTWRRKAHTFTEPLSLPPFQDSFYGRFIHHRSHQR